MRFGAIKVGTHLRLILHIPLQEMFKYLGELLCAITWFDSFPLQPNAGAVGEYVGLLVIRSYDHVGVQNS